MSPGEYKTQWQLRRIECWLVALVLGLYGTLGAVLYFMWRIIGLWE